MFRTPSSSGETPLPPAPLPDRRIVISLCIGVILFLYILSKSLYLRYNTHFNQESDALQVIWRDNNLAVAYTPDDTQAVPIALVEPEVTPFFFYPVPINQADTELLESIDGIGPHLASEILKLRREGFVFRDSSDLLRIPGIGAKKVRRLEKKFSFAETP